MKGEELDSITIKKILNAYGEKTQSALRISMSSSTGTGKLKFLLISQSKRLIKTKSLGASLSNPVPNAASFRDCGIHLRKGVVLSEEGVPLIQEVWVLWAKKLKVLNGNSCNMIKHWELLHQTPMKKCPECHSKRPIGESSSESEEDVTTSYRLPKQKP